MTTRARLRRRPVQRLVMGAIATALALTGGTVGHHLTTAASSPPASATTAGAPRSAGTAGPADRATTTRPTSTAPTTMGTAPPTTMGTAPPTTTAPTGTGTATPTTTAPTGTGTATPTPTAPTGTGTVPAATGATLTPTPRPASTTAPALPRAAGAAGAAGAASSPLAGATFYGPNAGAAQAAGATGTSPADAALLTQLAQVPTALWLGPWSGDVTRTVQDTVTAAQAAGGVPVFVVYDVPGRDCGGYSSGGADSTAAYASWIHGVAAGIGTARAVVIVEPDALAQLCGDQAQRYRMLDSAIDVLETNPGTHTYLDAGNPTWIDAGTMADRLRAAGVADADGFALNVSNFETTASNLGYGAAVSAALGGAHFVIDTSRNGNGASGEWCNPAGRAVGEHPTSQTGHTGVDAYLWVKQPGESDGTCNGGPPAGQFWAQYAVRLMRVG